MKANLKLLAMVLALGMLSACGSPGVPLPPSLNLPRPALDLAGTRKGDHVLLTWTPQRLTTDNAAMRPSRQGPTRICRAVDVFPVVACTAVGEAPASETPLPKPSQPPQKAQYPDLLPRQLQEQNATFLATYAVEATNIRGRSAGLSNQIRVPLAPTLPPPDILKAEVTPEGVVLSLPRARSHDTEDLKYSLRVYRRTEAGPDFKAAELPYGAASERVLDRSIEWEKTYFYRVTIVTSVPAKNLEVEGDDSPEVRVFAHDIFPPATPAEVQAVASGVGQQPFIDLTWAPDTDADLAGYNVYRHEPGAPALKINGEVVKIPSFRDFEVIPGHTYYYSVTAEDVRHNESPHSPETSERVP